MSLSELRELVMDREAWHAVIHGVAKSRTWLSDWTELKLQPKVTWHMQKYENVTQSENKDFNEGWLCDDPNTGISKQGEKAIAPHSSTLAWKIPWTEEPGAPQSMGSLGVGHDWATSLSLFTFMHWRRKWQPTPVFLPGESQGRGSLVGCRLWGHTELDMTDST